MEEGWILSKDAKNKYRKVRGIYTYDATTKKYILTPNLEVNYYEILLTKGRFTTISAKQFERIKQYRWFTSNIGKFFYASTKIDYKHIRMHRLLTNFEYEIVDHINGDCLFNIDENLRDGSNSVNQRNRKDVVGARLNERNDSYRGRFVAYNGLHKSKLFFCRDYTTEEDAKRAAFEWSCLNNQMVIEQIERDGPCPVEQRHVVVPLTSNSGHKNITHREKTNAYEVIILQAGKNISKRFSYAGQPKERALEEAIAFRDELLAANPPKERIPKKQKN